MAPLTGEELRALAYSAAGNRGFKTSTPNRKQAKFLDDIGTLLKSIEQNKDPLQGSKGALDAKVAAIIASNAPEQVKAKALQQSSSAPKDEAWYEQGLNTLGKLKSGVVATVGRIADPNRNWLKDVRNNVGVADLLANQQWYKDLKPTDKFVVGLLGDIALDPLTYLAGAGAVTKIGGAGGAAKLAFEASSAAKAAGATEEAVKLATIGQKASKGISTLNSAEKDVVANLAVAAGKISEGEKLGGLYLNVPGTGKIIGRKIGFANTVQIPVIPQGVTSSALPKAIRTVEEGVRASKVGQKTAQYLGGNEVKSALIGLVRRAKPETAAAASHALEAWNVGGARGADFLRQMEVVRSDLVNAAKSAKVDMTDITKGLGGDLAAVKRVEDAIVAAGGETGFMSKVRAFDNAIVDEAHRLVGRNFMNRIEDHAPTLRGPGVGKGGVSYEGGRSGFDPAGFEYRASKPGDTFQGETLLDPNKTSYGEVVGVGDEGQIITRHVPEAEVAAARAEGRNILEFGPDELGRDVKSQREAIVKAKFGEDAEAMYNMDWEQASAAQIRGMSTRIRGEVVKNHLRAKGVAKDIYNEVLSNAAIQAREVLPGMRVELGILNENAAFVQIARDYLAGDLKVAQENLAWVLKQSEENVAHARNISEKMAEAYGTVTETVQRMFDEAAAAGERLTNAVLDRKMAEEVLTVLGPDHPFVETVIASFKNMSDDLAKASESSVEQLSSLQTALERQQEIFKTLDDAYKLNLKNAERIDELVQRKAELTARLNEIQGISPEPPPLRGGQMGSGDVVEGVVLRETDPLKPSKRALKESRIVNDGQARETVVGRIVNTREANIVAEYDNLAAALDDFKAGTGTARSVKQSARALNEVLREARLPLVPVGGSPESMLERANQILADADLLKKPNVGKKISRASGREIRKINREMKALDAELTKLQELDPEASLKQLAEQRFLAADTLESFGARLPDLTTRAENAVAAERANLAKIEELRNQTVEASASRKAAVVQEKIDAEVAMREEASRLRQEALAADERFRVTREQVQAADDAALEAEAIAAMEIDAATAAVARLEASTLQMEADLARMTGRAERLESKIGGLATKENETVWQRVIDDGFARLDMTTQAPDQVVDALMQMSKLKQPGEIGKMLRGFDVLTGMFKSYAILTPGFHVRNFIGGMFNNYLAGVQMGSYRKFLQADKIFANTFAKTADKEQAFSAIARAMGKQHADAYRVVEASSALRTAGVSGSTAGDIGIGTVGMGRGRGFQAIKSAVKAKGRGNVIVDNPLTRINYLASERVERTLRGSLAYDVALKGGDEFEALGAVYKFHFNYDDLSSFEQTWMKRLSPFYTWSRKNVPLQVEMLFQKPGVYARIGYAQDAIERLSPPDELTPNWFYQVGGFRLPFTTPQGERMYMMPDLPPLDLRKVVNPQEWLGEINPVVKVPLELQFNKQLYNQQEFRKGYVPYPESWSKIGLGAITDAIGLSKIDANGQRVAEDSTLYAIESYLPILGRARRLAPSEEKYQRRVVSTWASMLFGLGFRANTESDKKGELYRRSKKVESLNTDLQTMGYGGYKTLNRDVAMTRGAKEGEKSPFLMVAEPKGGLPLGSPYTMPSKGTTGQVALNKALASLQSRGASQDLVDLARRVSEGRKK